METIKDSDKKSVDLKKVKTIKKNPLSKELLSKINAYWRAPTICQSDSSIFTKIHCFGSH